MLMETLSTRFDGLQWEVNRLDVDNKQLRVNDEEVSQQLQAGSVEIDR